MEDLQNKIDYTLYLVTDAALAAPRNIREIVRAAVAGGVTCVQLREKRRSTRECIVEALALQEFLKPLSIPLIINDRADIALAVRADGLHLGQTDMPIDMARRIVGASMIIGVSAESVEDAVRAERAGADYISVSPIFATPTKTDTAAPLGIEGLKAIRSRVATPLIGIGGLNRRNIATVIQNGADGVAVVSTVVCAEDPGQAAAELRDCIEKARAR